MNGKRLSAFTIICIFSCFLAINLSAVFYSKNSSLATPIPPTYNWNIPAGMPKPIVPPDNPISPEKVELGRHLFYEKRLSVTGEFSCASCHIQAKAFTDGKTVGVGATVEKHPRNPMSLANIGYNSVLTWANPLQNKLESQLLVPLFGEHPVEMGMVGKEEELLAMLRSDIQYQKMFAAAFSQEPNPINISNLAKAIASFERTLISLSSPYDRYRYSGDYSAISASAKRGEELFNSERLECFHCHGGLNFSDSIMHDRLAFKEIAFHNTGLYNIDGKGAYPPNNTGVYEITNEPSDMGKFKAPTLRNIALTAPYMHDGSIKTLEEVIGHYKAGGRTIKKGELAGRGSENPLKSNFVSGFKLTVQEQRDLLAFLQSLTDEDFIKNPAFSDPLVRSFGL
ncbi:MAG: di-heme enzyme [Microcoleus sp. PH2017_10_PVI_O_A]|uniref:methanobactin export MATE transporter MbnM n=1 Tax=unclassified Microcoleus TaxID=2642155 RepID=UPI001D6D32D5|nr:MULTISPECIES: methanobactin export MATE transporter MbnM [unclassified Microcoleus]TAE80668.1 MAG: di-heme enzyme [Oscillatoriales cyanobacterium]MCC3407464.1 di-heme enzyme [Microcoleus sp. PH2017_10_PVI_O_A]MCC3461544.1 di-heme enzyme [Microcoleus sp. PH2017_11_PCY_U_A]MCC3480019.1 di-heme enzyme [Microcoleus sp. PH2017_12_PCY_D_A]MCC3529870.1 di-heme enzyme [Microcoleus sp. PH2017_21_RUC_O_A]